MRVTVVAPVPPIPGGIAQHSARMIEALRDRGADVNVVSWSSQYPQFLRHGAARDSSATTFPGARFILRWWDATSWVRAGRIARRSDLLIMPWVTPFHAIVQKTIMQVARVPTSLLVHNVRPHERMPFESMLARLVLRSAAHVVVHAAPVERDVHDIAPAVTTSVVPHPPNFAVPDEPLPPAPPLRLLCVGYVRPYKGFDVAVDALRRLIERHVDARLTIAGEMWEDADSWNARVNDPPLQGRVELRAQYHSDAELGALLASHHVVVAPYISATQSGVVPLAIAARRPVVATDVGGLREAVESTGAGIVVPARDPEALADALAKMLADLDGYAARIHADRGWDAVADALLTPIRSAPDR